MKRSNLLQTIAYNWPVKVISLVMAAFVYLVVTFMTGNQRVVDLPLQVKLPETFVVASTLPQTVQVSIIGDDRAIHLIDPSSISATADFSVVTEAGVASVPVLLSYAEFSAPGKISITVTPEVVKASFITSPVSVQVEGASTDRGGIVL